MRSVKLIILLIMMMVIFSCGKNGEESAKPKQKEEKVVAKTINDETAGNEIKHEAEADFFDLGIDKKIKGPLIFDLFVSSLCPYGKNSERAIFKVMDHFEGAIELNIKFVNRIDSTGELISMFRDDGLFEDLRQTCIKKLYPDKFFEYLKIFNDPQNLLKFEDIVEKLGMDLDRLNDWYLGPKGTDLLIKDAEELESLGLERRSPTLLINGVRYNQRISSMSLYNDLCRLLETDRCKEGPPSNFSDSDGQKGEEEGCKDKTPTPSEPIMNIDKKKPEPVKFSTQSAEDMTHYIIDYKTKFSNVKNIIKETRKLFPRINMKIIQHDSKEGKEMIEKYFIKILPAYLFGEKITEHPNFEKIKETLYQREDMYILRHDVVKSSITIDREVVPGKIDLMLSSYSKKGNILLRRVLEEVEGLEKLNIGFHYFIVKDVRGKFITRRERPEIEENIRRLVIAKYFPDKLLAYLLEKSRDFDTTYWEDAVAKAGLDPKEIKKYAHTEEEVGAMLQGELDWLLDRNIDGDFVFYLNDNEAIYFFDKDNFEEFLEYLKERAKE